MDWPASSYSPENHTFITCGVTDRAGSFEQIPKASQVAGSAGGIGAGRLGVGDTSTANTGQLLVAATCRPASSRGTSTGLPRATAAR